MNRLFLIIFYILIAGTSTYSQSMDKIVIEHIGEIDKPFPIIELYSNDTVKTVSQNLTITIVSKDVSTKITKYLSGKMVGEITNYNMSYGTFCISLFEKDTVKKVYLNREGAIYLLVNIHSLLPVSNNEKLIEGMIRRLI